jgi:hypothetical protein
MLVTDALLDGQALPIPALGLLKLPPLLRNPPQLMEHNSLVMVVADGLIIIFETVEYIATRI